MSTNELGALSEKAKIKGDEEMESRRRKKRKKKVVDLHNPCVVWIEEEEHLEIVSNLSFSQLNESMHALPVPYRNTVRQEEEEEEEEDTPVTPAAGPTGWKFSNVSFLFNLCMN